MSDKKETKENKAESTDTKNMSKEEQIGFHKGSISTLAKERQELVRIVQIVEQLMQMHVSALKEHGIDLEKDMAAASGAAGAKPKKPEKPIEDML